MTVPILEAKGLRKYFLARKRALFGRSPPAIKAIDDIDLAIHSGETVGLVGESGCGKTTLSRLFLLLERPDAGCVCFEGRALASATAADRKRYRRAVQPVFQNPYSSLNPRMRIGEIVAEPLLTAGGFDRRSAARRVAEVLEATGLSPEDTSKYPFAFSGGQRQRIAIARALASSPRLIVLDEAISSQDVSIRAQILNLLKDLQRRHGLAYLFISHDLAAVRYMSDRIAVMYLGKIVEMGNANDICSRPLHPYTKSLLDAALPDDPQNAGSHSVPIGEVASAAEPPKGCRFHPRCPRVTPACRVHQPALGATETDRQVACFLY
jgi:oligopeptide/dipeptide ABC transporter ATP-binding protein